jgi:hypothetical protein
MHTRFYLGNHRERDHLEDQEVDGRIIYGSSESGVERCGLYRSSLVLGEV